MSVSLIMFLAQQRRTSRYDSGTLATGMYTPAGPARSLDLPPLLPLVVVDAGRHDLVRARVVALLVRERVGKGIVLR